MKNVIHVMLGVFVVVLFSLTGCGSGGSGGSGGSSAGTQSANQRYIINNNGTLTDKVSGLTWLANANCFGDQSYGSALSLAANLHNGQCGLSDGSSSGDWHVPTPTELDSLIASNYLTAGFSNLVTKDYFAIYWTQGIYLAGFNNRTVDGVSLPRVDSPSDQVVYVSSKIDYDNFNWKVWPVRF